jgi:hypothetical protein
MKMKLSRSFILALSIVISIGTIAGAGESRTLSYNRDIRAILSKNCFSCHGTDSASRKAGLRLDHFETATNKLDDGAVAIVPGHPTKAK